MITDIYNDKILYWSSKIVTPCRLSDPSYSFKTRGKLCGSTFIIDLIVADNIILAYGHDVNACKIGSAAAAMLQHLSVGTDVREIREVDQTLRAMLFEDGNPPDGRWSDLDMFLPLRGNRFRATTSLLPFDAIVKIIDLIT